MERAPVDIFWSRELTPADSSSDLTGRTMASFSVKLHGTLKGPAPQVSCTRKGRSETLASERQTQRQSERQRQTEREGRERRRDGETERLGDD